MRRVIGLLPLLLLIITTASAQQKQQNPEVIAYVEHYYPHAIRDMEKYGIPASIKLAQGVLESGWGKSDLATRSNNHFGIKCKSDWTGKKVYHDDDELQECFRSYDDVYESYNDHSLFLVSGKRYAFLFDYKTDDYKSWARGLKKAGYATNPVYAEKLIDLIELYELYKYDNYRKYGIDPKGGVKSSSEIDNKTKLNRKELREQRRNNKHKELSSAAATGIILVPAPSPKPKPEAKPASKPSTNNSNSSTPNTNSPTQRPPVTSAQDIPVMEQGEVVYSGLTLSQLSEVIAGNKGGRTLYMRNEVKYVRALEGDSWESLERVTGKKRSKLYIYNDITDPQAPIKEGDIIFIGKKRKSSPMEYVRYTVEHDGVTIHTISQHLGVLAEILCEENSLAKNEKLPKGKVVILR